MAGPPGQHPSTPAWPRRRRAHVADSEVSEIFIRNNATGCSNAVARRDPRFTDLWMGTKLRHVYGGRLPSLDEVTFFKTSRVISDDIAKQINLTGGVTWFQW